MNIAPIQNNMVMFGMIFAGEMVYYDQGFYMKIKTPAQLEQNAVDLESGYLLTIPVDALVTPYPRHKVILEPEFNKDT